MTSQELLNQEFSKETIQKIIKACPVQVGDLVYWSFSEEQAKNPTDVRLVIGLGIFKVVNWCALQALLGQNGAVLRHKVCHVGRYAWEL